MINPLHWAAKIVFRLGLCVEKICSRPKNVTNDLGVKSQNRPIACVDGKFIGSSEHDFKLGFLNIQCLRNKCDVVNDFSNDVSLDLLCLSEHWCCRDELDFQVLDDFQLGSSFCREYHSYGGTAIYLKGPLLSIGTRLDLDFICSEFNFEVAGFCLAKLKLVIVALYRSPGGDPNMFLERLVIH